jgi:hypothetical protein
VRIGASRASAAVSLMMLALLGLAVTAEAATTQQPAAGSSQDPKRIDAGGCAYVAGVRCLVLAHEKYYSSVGLRRLTDWINRRGYEVRVAFDQWDTFPQGERGT